MCYQVRQSVCLKMIYVFSVTLFTSSVAIEPASGQAEQLQQFGVNLCSFIKPYPVASCTYPHTPCTHPAHTLQTPYRHPTHTLHTLLQLPTRSCLDSHVACCTHKTLLWPNRAASFNQTRRAKGMGTGGGLLRGVGRVWRMVTVA